jgi:hypothetical protein
MITVSVGTNQQVIDDDGNFLRKARNTRPHIYTRSTHIPGRLTYKRLGLSPQQLYWQRQGTLQGRLEGWEGAERTGRRGKDHSKEGYTHIIFVYCSLYCRDSNLCRRFWSFCSFCRISRVENQRNTTFHLTGSLLSMSFRVIFESGGLWYMTELEFVDIIWIGLFTRCFSIGDERGMV